MLTGPADACDDRRQPSESAREQFMGVIRMRFEGKRVIVTGAGSGFGEAIARRFAAEGAKVLAADLDLAGAERVAGEIGAAGGIALPQLVNVAEEDQVEAMVQRAADEWGGVDVLVNNAGYSHRQKLLWKISVEEFDAVFGVNVRGVFLGCKHAIPVMMEAGGGAIVNIASVGAVAPRPGVTPYNGTKGAVLTMTKGLALECARHNIRVNAVNPVAAETGFMKGGDRAGGAFGRAQGQPDLNHPAGPADRPDRHCGRGHLSRLRGCGVHYRYRHERGRRPNGVESGVLRPEI